jgi:hypothetical protein
MTSRGNSSNGPESLDSSESGNPQHPGFVSLLHQALKDARLDGVLIGGHAVNFWVDPRFTHDVDLTVKADRRGIGEVVSALLAQGFEVVRSQDAGEESGPDFVRLGHTGKNQYVDLIPAKTPFQAEVIRRADRENERMLPVATVEDLIIFKLIAHRSKDALDARHLAELPDIDWAYIQRWAAEWGESDRFEELRRSIRSEG